MNASNKIELALGICLPYKYKVVIDTPPSFNDEYAHDTYLSIDADRLIGDNKGYLTKTNDISDIDDGTFLGRVKRFILYGSKRKIIAHRKKYRKRWVDKSRFIIGTDGGEESFFIHLNDDTCAVFVYEFETHKSYKKFKTITEYIEYVNAVVQSTILETK